MELNNIKPKGTWGEASTDINTNFSKVNNAVSRLEASTTRNKGYYLTVDALKEAFPTSSSGSIAYVGSKYPFNVYRWDGDEWVNSGTTGGAEELNLGNYATQEDVKDIFSSLFVPVESEEVLREMLESGDYDPQKIYYVIES